MAEKRHIVTVISAVRRYKMNNYPSIAIYREDWDTYITGQHINPNDPETRGNLTKAQMFGEEPLTEAQKQKFRYVINPANDARFSIRDNMKLDVTVVNNEPVNPKDYAYYNYLLHQDIVAKDKASFDKSIHRFYLEDKEKEAAIKLSKREKIYQVVEKVRKNLSIEKLTDLAIMLNYYVKDFMVRPDQISKTLLEEKIYETCESYPEEVAKCFEEGWKDNLYILKLAEKGILKRKGDDFFDGGVYVGKGLEGVKAFMSKEDNRASINKWASLMSGQGKIEDNKNAMKGLKVLTDALFSLAKNDIAAVNHSRMQLEEMGESEHLKSLDEAIASAKEAGDKTSDEKTEEERKEMLTLKQQAGRLGIEKEVYQSANAEELKKLIEAKKVESK